MDKSTDDRCSCSWKIYQIRHVNDVFMKTTAVTKIGLGEVNIVYSFKHRVKVTFQQLAFFKQASC